MEKKTVFLTSILGVVIFLSVFAVNVMAEKTTPGAFSSGKTDRSLIKDILVGQQEIKAALQQLNNKIDGVSMCK